MVLLVFLHSMPKLVFEEVSMGRAPRGRVGSTCRKLSALGPLTKPVRLLTAAILAAAAISLPAFADPVSAISAAATSQPPASPSSGSTPLTTIGAVKALPPARAAQAIPVRLDAVVTYYQPAESMLYVQDATGAIYVHTLGIADIHVGSRVVVSGVTAASYRNTVMSADVRSIGEAPLPVPKHASFDDLIGGVMDCDYVEIKGTVLSSTIQRQVGTPFLLLEMLVDGGPVLVHVLNFAGFDPNTFLGAEVSVAGPLGKTFDGKFESVGTKLNVEDASSIQILSRSAVSPMDLPISPFGSVEQSYSATSPGRRIHVRGTVTLYNPGEVLVLDQHGKTLLVHTRQDDPLLVGQVVDVVGFPDYHDYAPSLSYGEFAVTPLWVPVGPKPITYDEAMTGKYSFNVVSLTGVLVAEVHEDKEDTLVLKSGDHIFSATLRSLGGTLPMPALKVGGTLRVTGICMINAAGPYNSPVDFDLALRSPVDVVVLSQPSWMTVERLSLIASILIAIVVAALLWADMLRRRVAAQTEVIRRTALEDAAWERRSVYLEKERGLVLEAINSAKPLDSVLELIAAFIGKQIWGITCSFRLPSTEQENGEGAESFDDHEFSTEYAHDAETGEGKSTQVRAIESKDGTKVALMTLVTNGQWHSSAHIEEVLDIGGRLAALAIENRTLNEKLVHRSEYDQLTDVPNRFAIEGRLDEAIAEATESGANLAVIYVDLDEFKQINDLYGHRIGDLYLRQAAQRLSAQLRDRDLIARIGGDEFLAIVHDISGREEAEQIAGRLAGCFRHPFSIEDLQIRGAASIGIGFFPEDGQDGEELKRSADHAMYTAKRKMKLSVSS
jgi:diguanylate cyclase (GGDEF)-like protein